MSTTVIKDDIHASINRVYGLDVFRAWAILFVLIGHSFGHSKITPEIKAFARVGILGVELFFVLSGFLIGSIIMRLIDEQRFHSITDIVVFWKRRWLRTLPMYFVALLAFLRVSGHGLFDYPAYFIFMQNFAWKIPEFFELAWSLAIEEHFYLWFPLFFLFWKRVAKQAHLAIILTAISFILISYGFRLSHPVFSDWNEYNRTIRMSVLARMDAIMFGVLIAAIKFYWHTGFSWIKRCTPVTAALFMFLCAWWFAGIPYLMHSAKLQLNLFTIQAILSALLLPWFDGLHASGGRKGFFIVTSKISYSLYLLHILVIIEINKVLQGLGMFEQVYNNPFILYPLYFSFFYLVSWGSYNLIEKPFLHLREIPWTWQTVCKASWSAILCCATLIVFF